MNKIFLNPRLSLKEQALFARRLSMLVRAGVPILASINMLRKQTKGAKKKMFERISHDVSNGQFLSKSMLKFKKVFGDFAINIIKVGETSGTLSENLSYLAEELDKKRELKGKIVSALVYPAVIMVSAIAVSSFLVIYLFPKLLPVFRSLNADLPLSTRALIALSRFLSNYGILVLAAIFFGLIAFVFSLRFRPVRYATDFFLLQIPVLGRLFRNYHITNTCRTMGLLLKGQLTAVEAIGVAADTSANLLYKKELLGLKHAITRGSGIAKHLEKNAKLFPPILTDMVAIAEATGNLSDTLIYLAQIYEQELDEENKQLSSIIEPAMMIVMGFLVGFIAVSIITPIYEITQHITPR